MQRRHFTDEFKREAVKLAKQPGATKSAIARDLGIGVNLLARWQRDQDGTAAAVSPAKAGAVSPEEYERMRRELVKVKMERDIFKKALGFFAAEPK